MKRLIMAMVIAAAITIPTSSVAAKQLEAAFPSFDVTINGVTVENTFRRYLYNDRLYLPLTYTLAEEFFREYSITQDAGLIIGITNRI